MVRDLRDRRFIDVYSVAIVAFVLAVVSVVGYGSDQLRWTVVLAALGLLVLRISVPETGPEASLDELLLDRGDGYPGGGRHRRGGGSGGKVEAGEKPRGDEQVARPEGRKEGGRLNDHGKSGWLVSGRIWIRRSPQSGWNRR